MVGCQQWSCGAQHPRSTSGKAIVIVLGVVQKSCEIHASGHDRSFFFCDFSLKIICCTARQHANERSSRSCCTTVPTSFNPRRCDCGSLRRRSPDLQCITLLHSVTNWTISCNQQWHLFHIHVRTKLSLDGCTKHTILLDGTVTILVNICERKNHGPNEQQFHLDEMCRQHA